MLGPIASWIGGGIVAGWLVAYAERRIKNVKNRGLRWLSGFLAGAVAAFPVLALFEPGGLPGLLSVFAYFGGLLLGRSISKRRGG